MTGFDFIVVGSGSGGAAVAGRLARAGASVAVIEAGDDPISDPRIADPSQWFGLQQSEWDWGQAYLPSDRLDGRVVPIPRARALGGCSATNAMMWYRGVPADYARWEAVAPGWGWADCLPAFQACEDAPFAPGRGLGGPLKISQSDDSHPLTRAMLEGGAEMGLPVLADPNGPEPFGVALANFNIHQGRRFTAADGYLRGVPGLVLLTGARALHLLFTGDRATGVRIAQGTDTRDLQATRGVIVAAGALETPRLLILSGIGPEAELARLGLPCRISAPAVGQNLQDHPLLRALNFRARVPMGPMQGNGGGTLTIWKSDPALAQADLLAFPIQGRSAVPALWDHYDLDGDLFAIGAGVMRSHSRGSLRLRDTHPDTALEIDPNLLGDPRDLTAICRSVEFLQDMVQTPAFADLFHGFAAPDRHLPPAEIEPFVRRACSTFFHCCGTARMGADSDAVCSPRLAVNGTRGLWIADASVIPEIPACHTHAPVTMIGERAATFILEDA